MDGNKILQILEREGLDEIDQIDYKDNMLVFDFFYTYDQPELEAAKSYADENADKNKGKKEWYDKYFLPYLTDIAADNIQDILEDLCEDMGLQGEFVAYEIDSDSYEQCEFAMVVAEEGVEINIDEILDKLEL